MRSYSLINIGTKKKKNKTTQRLMKVKRHLKRNKTSALSKTKRKFLNKHFYEEKCQKYAKEITRAVEELRRDGGGLKEESFWEFKRKLNGSKKEITTSMEDENGKMITEKEGIKKVYKDIYRKLFENPKEIEDEERVKIQMEEIERKAKEQSPMEITSSTIKAVIKKLKKKKAGDLEGWTNEMIIEGGDEMIKSLEILFKMIHQTTKIPTQWEEMKINLTHWM